MLLRNKLPYYAMGSKQYDEGGRRQNGEWQRGEGDCRVLCGVPLTRQQGLCFCKALLLGIMAPFFLSCCALDGVRAFSVFSLWAREQSEKCFVLNCFIFFSFAGGTCLGNFPPFFSLFYWINFCAFHYIVVNLRLSMPMPWMCDPFVLVWMEILETDKRIHDFTIGPQEDIGYLNWRYYYICSRISSILMR